MTLSSRPCATGMGRSPGPAWPRPRGSPPVVTNAPARNRHHGPTLPGSSPGPPCCLSTEGYHRFQLRRSHSPFRRSRCSNWRRSRYCNPGDEEIVIRVHAARTSVNPVDYKESGMAACLAVTGTFEMLPVTLGRDVSGTARPAAPGLTFKVGDPIYAMLGLDRGGYADGLRLKTTRGVRLPMSMPRVLGKRIKEALDLFGQRFRKSQLPCSVTKSFVEVLT